MKVTDKELAALRKAAAAGDATAQNNLGSCYSNGQGVAQDYEQAVIWYAKAAEQGVACAKYNLGNCYRKGTGVPEDMAKAIELIAAAAEQG
jgi:TPR repeat protein